MSFVPRAIVVHCSASQWGQASDIDAWHFSNGWDGIGYHGVILNGCLEPGKVYQKRLDGLFQPGRMEGRQGAHCIGGAMNKVALGICLIGTPGFKPVGDVAPEWCFQGVLPSQRQRIAWCTVAQFNRLVHKCVDWCTRYAIAPGSITQHSMHDKGKPLCASLNVRYLRHRVWEEMQ